MGITADNHSTSSVFMLTADFCLVWAVAALVKAFHPTIYDCIAQGGGFIWFCYYVLLPFSIPAVVKDTMGKSIKLDIAYYTLLGCCDGVMCMEWVSHFVTVRGYIYAPVVLIFSICGFVIGDIRLTHTGFCYRNDRVTAGDILAGIVYGSVAGIILSSVFPYRVSEVYREISGCCFYIVMLCVSVVYPLIMYFLYSRRAKEYICFKSELDDIIHSLNDYDQNIKRYQAEKDARAAKERQEKAACEKAERERRAREERVERERRERERREREYQERARRERAKRDQEASWEKLAYFDGCKNLTDLKRRYHKLCKKLHPDCGGTAESFLKMQKEYDRVYSRMAG